MQPTVLRTGVLLACILIPALCVYPQDAPAPAGPAPTAPVATPPGAPGSEPQGIPPRATPGDYQAHAQAGAVTVAAEFIGHFVPTPQGTLTTEDYVTVEVGLFGEAGTRLKLSPDNFSLRIVGLKMAKKPPVPSQPYGLVIGNVKDPEWSPPESASSSKSSGKTTFNTGGGGQDNLPPPPVHVPIEVQRANAQRVQKASLAEGDRALPQAGLVFFSYHGNLKSIRTIELIYNGPTGKASLSLQP